MTEHFCTYFDHRYAPKGLAMWRSLKAHMPSAVLHVLCLTNVCRDLVAALGLPDVHLHTLDELEAADDQLVEARANRSRIEYYFTLTPCLPLHVCRTHPRASRITYVDADLYFVADPQPVFDEIGESAIGLIEHRFPPRLAEHLKYGRFNVGWVTVRNTAAGLAALESWRTQCLEWCHDRLEDGRFAEQKYLDDWPGRFPGVHVVAHRGANVAPWNVDTYDVSFKGTAVIVGGDPLLFFHAHGFQASSPAGPRVVNLEPYGAREDDTLRRGVFDPYEAAVVNATGDVAVPLALALLAEQPRDLPRLQDALDACEADRAARLNVIHGLGERLERTEAERLAQLRTVEALRGQLAAIEADRTTSIEVIRNLERRLEAREMDLAARVATIDGLRRQLDESEATRVEAVRALQNDIERGRAALGLVAARVEAMERSLSWRWTRLLRWMAAPLMNKVRRT
jgi:hypothetical protein